MVYQLCSGGRTEIPLCWFVCASLAITYIINILESFASDVHVLILIPCTCVVGNHIPLKMLYKCASMNMNFF